jgi:hypothetical protein
VQGYIERSARGVFAEFTGSTAVKGFYEKTSERCSGISASVLLVIYTCYYPERKQLNPVMMRRVPFFQELFK